MLFGKVFQHLFKGSMAGQSGETFAVWVWIIAHMQVHKEAATVEVNPYLLGPVFNMTKERVMEILLFLESPDEDTTTPDEEGRRLILESKRKLNGAMQYRVVNGLKYFEIRNADARRASNRKAQKKYMANKKADEAGPPWDPEGKDKALTR